MNTPGCPGAFIVFTPLRAGVAAAGGTAYIDGMPVYDVYSKRKRRAEQTEPDVYQYDHLPEPVRFQIQHIWDDAIGPYRKAGGPSYGEPPPDNNEMWKEIRKILCREKGRMTLAGLRWPKDDCAVYLLAEANIDHLLDVVELTFFSIDEVIRKWDAATRRRRGIKQDPDDAIEELNDRFQEAGVGYRFTSGRIVRVDSELMHTEVTEPALALLREPRFKGPQQEFLAAHTHFRRGEHEDAIVDANRAFESTLKAICHIKGWPYDEGATAGRLVNIVRDNGLFPDFLGTWFEQLAGTLKSGLPQVRNRAGGHGQGPVPRVTPPHVAGYALHQAGAAIVLLVEALKHTEGRQGSARH